MFTGTGQNWDRASQDRDGSGTAACGNGQTTSPVQHSSLDHVPVVQFDMIIYGGFKNLQHQNHSCYQMFCCIYVENSTGVFCMTNTGSSGQDEKWWLSDVPPIFHDLLPPT